MSVYRELASELRANKAVIDSLNSRNQQLLQQNQFLKQEIHTLVQSALSVGQAAGIARPAPHLGQNSEPINGMSYSAQGGFPNAIAPDTLARLAQMEASATPIDRPYERASAPPTHRTPSGRSKQPNVEPEQERSRLPRPIAPATQKSNKKAAAKPSNPKNAKPRATQPKKEPAIARPNSSARGQITQPVGKRTEPVVAKQSNPPKPKLFTEQPGAFRSATLDEQEGKEISGIWLVLSIVLIVVTAFGAGFLIMKPLLNDR